MVAGGFLVRPAWAGRLLVGVGVHEVHLASGDGSGLQPVIVLSGWARLPGRANWGRYCGTGTPALFEWPRLGPVVRYALLVTFSVTTGVTSDRRPMGT